MQIVRERTSKKAIYMFPDFEPIDMDASRMVVGRLKALDIKDTTHEVVTADAPDMWVGGGVLSYDLAWAVDNQEAYDEVVTAKNLIIMDNISVATQARLDDFVKTRNYDGILSACSYTTSLNPKFSAEAAYCVEVRDDTWAVLYQILGEVEAGTRPVPASYNDIEAELPLLVWPTV